VDVAPWLACAESIDCSGFVTNQRLTVQRLTPETGGPAIVLSGSVGLTAEGEGKDMPAERTSVTVEVAQ
jgi:hypothetical protein